MGGVTYGTGGSRRSRSPPPPGAGGTGPLSRRPGRTPDGWTTLEDHPRAVCRLLSMTSPAATRIHMVITFVLVTTGAVGGASLGLLLGGRLLAVVIAGAAGLGAGIAAFLVRREVFALLRPDHSAPAIDGYAQGIADAVLAHIATCQASVFPLTPEGVKGRWAPLQAARA